MYKLPERRGGGGEVIWAMPERKHSFLHEVFPYTEKHFKKNTLLLDFLPQAEKVFTCTLCGQYTKQPYHVPIKMGRW